MKKRGSLYIILAVLLAALLAAGGCGKSSANEQEEGAAGAAPVSTVKARLGLLNDSTTVSGKLEAVQSANVVAKIPGKVAAVHVDIGSVVKAGQLMVTLENDTQKAAVSQAAAGVAQAKAGLARAEADLITAKASYQVDKANYERNKELLAADAISQSAFESIELTYKKSKENVERTLPAALASSRAALQSAQAALQSAQATYNDTLIKAPFSGVVTARNINPGEMASSAAPVVTVVNLDKVIVKATVNEDMVNQLKQGQEVTVKVGAISAEPFKGIVSNIALAADSASKAFPIKVQIDNSKHQLKPGMFAEVQLSKDRAKALLVPREAVVREGDKDVVWTVKNGTAGKQEVKAGESDGKQIIILSGLAEGDEVVTAGQESLQDGAKVNVRN